MTAFHDPECMTAFHYPMTDHQSLMAMTHHHHTCSHEVLGNHMNNHAQRKSY